MFFIFAFGANGAERTFEVASIKPVDRNEGVPRPQWGPVAVNIRGTLKELIQIGFGVEEYQISGGPPWLDIDYYVISAKATAPSTVRQLHEMLATLLTDRFRLRTHSEARSMSVYVLEKGRASDKLKPGKEGRQVDGPGAIQVDMKTTSGFSASMRLLASHLRTDLGVPVRDYTNLEGGFDFTLDVGYNPDEAPLEKVSGITRALRDLGLRVQPKKVTVPLMIIESADHPSAN